MAELFEVGLERVVKLMSAVGLVRMIEAVEGCGRWRVEVGGDGGGWERR